MVELHGRRQDKGGEAEAGAEGEGKGQGEGGCDLEERLVPARERLARRRGLVLRRRDRVLLPVDAGEARVVEARQLVA